MCGGGANAVTLPKPRQSTGTCCSLLITKALAMTFLLWRTRHCRHRQLTHWITKPQAADQKGRKLRHEMGQPVPHAKIYDLYLRNSRDCWGFFGHRFDNMTCELALLVTRRHGACHLTPSHPGTSTAAVAVDHLVVLTPHPENIIPNRNYHRKIQYLYVFMKNHDYRNQVNHLSIIRYRND